MHIVVFIAGTVLSATAAVVFGYGSGLSVWALLGLFICVIVLAQVVYLAFIAAMTRAETATRHRAKPHDATQPAASPESRSPVQET